MLGMLENLAILLYSHPHHCLSDVCFPLLPYLLQMIPFFEVELILIIHLLPLNVLLNLISIFSMLLSLELYVILHQSLCLMLTIIFLRSSDSTLPFLNLLVFYYRMVCSIV